MTSADQDALDDAYMRGSRMAWLRVLQLATTHLGYDDLEARHALWIQEREGAIGALREVCGGYGDNDWPDNLDLYDIIHNHLLWHLLDTE
jgi:hypothetical protein